MEKPRLKREWAGRHVRTLRELKTRGGVVFKRGEIMRVLKNYGGLNLFREWVCPTCGNRERYITGISERDVELLPQDYQPEPPAPMIALTPELIGVFRRVTPLLTPEEQQVVLGILPEIGRVES